MKNLKKILLALLICVMAVSLFAACNETPSETPKETPSGETPGNNPSGDDPSHTHVFGENWQGDAENHWLQCECGEKKDSAAHTFGEGVKENGKIVYTCSVCAQTKEEKDKVSEVVSKYYGFSIPETHVDTLAEYNLNADGLPVYVNHYALTIHRGGAYSVASAAEYNDFYRAQFFLCIREEYEYDENGVLKSIYTYYDPYGYQVGGYGFFGAEQTECCIIKFENDGNGKLTKAYLVYEDEEDEPEKLFTFEYGQDGRICTVNVYDNADTSEEPMKIGVKDGKIVTVEDDNYTITYDQNGNMIKAEGSYIAEYEYEEGRLTKVTVDDDANRTVLSYKYTDGLLTESVRTMGGKYVKMVYTYTPDKKLQSYVESVKVGGVDTVSEAVTYSYNSDGKPHKFAFRIYEESNKWTEQTMTFTYDDKGRVAKTESEYFTSEFELALQKRIVVNEYNEDDRPVSVVSTTYNYNGETKDYYKSGETLQTLVYDSEGRICKYTEESRVFTVDGKTVDGRIQETVYEYTENGRIVTTTESRFNTVDNKFAEEGKTVSEYNKDGDQIGYMYYYKGELRYGFECGIDKNGETYVKKNIQVYDNGNKEVTEYNEYGAEVSKVVYDPSGNVISESKTEVAYTYDDQGRPITATHYNNGVLAYAYIIGYRANGEMYVKKSSLYDEKGKLSSEKEYDEYNNLTSQAYYDENGILVGKISYAYTYSQEGDLLSKKVYGMDGKIVEEYKYAYSDEGMYTQWQITYQADGSRIEEKFEPSGIKFAIVAYDKNGNKLYSEYCEFTYDDHGNVLRVQITRDGTVVRVEYYRENDYGNRYKYKCVEYLSDNKKKCTYFDEWEDPIGYEDYESNTVVYSEGHIPIFDVNDNLVGKKRYEYNVLIDEVIYGFDNEGERYEAKQINYHSDGTRTEFTYNVYGDLIYYIDYDANENITWQRRYEYEYDEWGNILSEKEYDGDKLIYECVYGEGIGGIIARMEIVYEEDGSRRIYEYDKHGSTIKLVTYDKDNVKVEDLTYEQTYDEDGNRVCEKLIKGGKVTFVTEYFPYDQVNCEKIMRETDYLDDGTVMVIEYSVDGRSKIRMTYDANGVLAEKSLYEYYEDGQLARRRKYTYGVLTEDVIYGYFIGWGGTGSKEETYYYENGNKKHYIIRNDHFDTIRSEDYDESGRLTEYYDYEYEYYPNDVRKSLTRYDNGIKNYTEHYKLREDGYTKYIWRIDQYNDDGSYTSYYYSEETGICYKTEKHDKNGNLIV